MSEEDDARILREKIDIGFKEGVAMALEEHRRMGRKVVMWQDGKVVHVDPPPMDPEVFREMQERHAECRRRLAVG